LLLSLQEPEARGLVRRLDAGGILRDDVAAKNDRLDDRRRVLA